jgi:hypothetical protein
MGIKYIFVKVDVELATKSTPHALQANSTTHLILVIERTMTQQRATKHTTATSKRYRFIAFL